MAKLSDGASITTVQDKEIVLTGTDGQFFKMKITDLAEAVRQVMQVATSENNGLMGREYAETRHNVGTGGHIILTAGVYVIKSSYFGVSAILAVSGNGPTFLAKESYYVDYTSIEKIDPDKCKLTSLYPISIVLYVTRLSF